MLRVSRAGVACLAVAVALAAGASAAQTSSVTTGTEAGLAGHPFGEDVAADVKLEQFSEPALEMAPRNQLKRLLKGAAVAALVAIVLALGWLRPWSIKTIEHDNTERGIQQKAVEELLKFTKKFRVPLPGGGAVVLTPLYTPDFKECVKKHVGEKRDLAADLGDQLYPKFQSRDSQKDEQVALVYGVGKSITVKLTYEQPEAKDKSSSNS